VSASSALVGVVLPPITLGVFIAAMVIRIRSWRKLPKPGMTLFPTPHGSATMGVLKETLLFPSLFRGDKALWVLSWVFHAMLALVFIGHIRVVTDFPALWSALHIDADTMSAVVGGTAGILMLTMAALLLFRRALVARVSQISGAGDYFALFLVLAVVVTGNAMRFLGHFDLAQTRAYFVALVTFSAAPVPQNPWFLLHFCLAQALIIYIPFSKILHFGGVFFTQAALKRS
jgi:nitrate reductase gamma subunit